MPAKRQYPATSKGVPKASKKSRDDFINDGSDSEGSGPAEKKVRKEKTNKPLVDGVQKKDDEGNSYWELGGKLRRVTLSEYKGAVLVNIREYYEKDGHILPGRKGISLSLEQYNNLLSVMPQIETVLKKKSSMEVLRPQYEASVRAMVKKAKEEEEVEEEESWDELEETKDEVKDEDEEEPKVEKEEAEDDNGVWEP